MAENNFTSAIIVNMKQVFSSLSMMLLLIALPLTSFIATSFITNQTPEIAPFPPLRNFTGGFSIDTVGRISNAAADGIQVAVYYGAAPAETSSLGQALKAHHMKAIDGMLNSYLDYYECHIHRTCSLHSYPELTDVEALLTDVRRYLQQIQDNSLIVGYWILDDWLYEDYGSAKDILIQMNRLIHQYTPGRPSICGFGGEIPPLPSKEYKWVDGIAANFSPEGCDMVGLYIYAEPYTDGIYDWTMHDILSTMLASLKKRGWDITKEPLVGIPQAFGDLVGGDSWPIPTANGIETQTITYCQRGAIGILYYAWDNSGLTPTSQLPWNNAEITQGIRNGVAICNSLWASHYLSK